MEKNLLSDTSYTKGHDNRFGISSAFGKVSKLEVTAEHANVRVIMRDRLDHKNNPMISKPIPVLQIASQAKKQFAMPRVDDVVALMKLPNGTGNYCVIGSFYTKSNPPPVTDPMLDHTLYDDGSTQQFDASKGQLDWNLKGDYNYTGDKNWNLTNKQDVNIKPQNGNVDIKAAGITLEGPLTIKGDITHTGNMTTSGTHTDSAGHHTSAARQQELEARVAALEARLDALERRLL